MTGLRTAAAAPSKEGRGRGQSLSRNDPGFKDAGNAKQVLHPNPAQSQAFLVSSWGAGFGGSQLLSRRPAVTRNSEEQRGGGEGDGDLVEQEDRAGHYNSLSLKRLLGPSFPSLPPTAHFTRPGRKPGQARWPRATASPFSWDPRRSASLIHRPRSSPSATPTYSLCGVGSAMLSRYLDFLLSQVGKRPKTKTL